MAGCAGVCRLPWSAWFCGRPNFLVHRRTPPPARRCGAPDVSITVMPAAGSEQDILRMTGQAYGYGALPRKSLENSLTLGMLEVNLHRQIMNLEHLPIILSSQLQNLPSGTTLLTPDIVRSRRFSVLRYRDDALYVVTQGGTEIRIPLQAFVRTLAHMHESRSCAHHPSLIRSSNMAPPLGGLCDISRGMAGDTRWITYLLPVLQHLGRVHINGEQRPNTAWLTTME